ncbi:uncharacterized protein BCR38DRAFT_435065 [Pseudomassariella vexata]|uniref:Uncharacterized protein n=1 Tax=Pseudomassariella vexata TaxID=1141098 RepID=A0A1Y2DYT8_9PEZI|nr:uncharacterized protein BCR38DRAFT_435065 [Pseudomassariella vexata]ORY64423.1 hypothetical protein BCR38DRAFT_435065 [Pseudomassariella vexata]
MCRSTHHRFRCSSPRKMHSRSCLCRYQCIVRVILADKVSLEENARDWSVFGLQLPLHMDWGPSLANT